MWFVEMSRHLHQILLQEGIAAAANNLQGVYKSIFELAHTFENCREDRDQLHQRQ